MNILITGGAGFIGSALVRFLSQKNDIVIGNIDKLTYSGNLNSLPVFNNSTRYKFFQVDINNSSKINAIFESFKPNIVMNLAAESHVDRSINSSFEFIETNVKGTHVLLEASRLYWSQLPVKHKETFRFHHISTDEVYGDLGDADQFFTEESAYKPSSPYSASKAAADHLVKAWHRTYGLPTLITNCSNNYGPYQFPEKLIPHMILSAIQGKNLCLYGNGKQSRDWLFVEDHVRALYLIATKGNIGQTYNIGTGNARSNLSVVGTICDLMQELYPSQNSINYKDLICFIKDRPGHDIKYAIDYTKLSTELGWQPEQDFFSGMRKTVEWYLKNTWWWEKLLGNNLQLSRLGLA